MSTKIQKIDYAVLRNPTLIPILIKDCSINNGLIYSRMRRFVPRRVGIEFECIGNPLDYYKCNFKENIEGPKDFEKIFNLLSYNQDWSITRSDPDTNSNQQRGTTTIDSSNSLQLIEDEDLESYNELRVSIKDYSQLQGLYNILKIFKDSCIKPIGGGIHIHIDFRDYNDYSTRVIVKWYIKNHLREVENIFPEYKGTYNKRLVGLESKGTYVNLSRHGSIEFRIAPLTFDYEELIKWIVACNKFVTKIIHECHLIPDDKLKLREESVNPNLTASTNFEIDPVVDRYVDLGRRLANLYSDYTVDHWSNTVRFNY